MGRPEHRDVLTYQENTMATDNYIPEGTQCDECGVREAVYQWFDFEAGELRDLCAECREAMDDD